MTRFRSGVFGPLLASLLLLPLHSQAPSFTKLAFQDGQPTGAAGLRFLLQEPDNPAHPTLWQGPLVISRGSAQCTVDASLIRDVFLSATGRLAVVVSISGSDTFVHFFNPSTCARTWPAIKAFTQGASISGSRLTLLPACACGDQGRPCSCTAASVYALRDNAPPLRLPAASRALTRQTLGVAFTGTRTFAHLPAARHP